MLRLVHFLKDSIKERMHLEPWLLVYLWFVALYFWSLFLCLCFGLGLGLGLVTSEPASTTNVQGIGASEMMFQGGQKGGADSLPPPRETKPRRDITVRYDNR